MAKKKNNTSPVPSLIPNRIMGFSEALEEIKNGAKVHKVEWQDLQYFVCLHEGTLRLHKPDGKYYDWIIRSADLEGEDWVIA